MNRLVKGLPGCTAAALECAVPVAYGSRGMFRGLICTALLRSLDCIKSHRCSSCNSTELQLMFTSAPVWARKDGFRRVVTGGYYVGDGWSTVQQRTVLNVNVCVKTSSHNQKCAVYPCTPLFGTSLQPGRQPHCFFSVHAKCCVAIQRANSWQPPALAYRTSCAMFIVSWLPFRTCSAPPASLASFCSRSSA